MGHTLTGTSLKSPDTANCFGLLVQLLVPRDSLCQPTFGYLWVVPRGGNLDMIIVSTCDTSRARQLLLGFIPILLVNVWTLCKFTVPLNLQCVATG